MVKTLDERIEVDDVHESPASSQKLMVCNSGVFLVEGDHSFRVPRMTFTSYGRKEPREVSCDLTGIAFGPESIWLAERGAGLRCIDYTCCERWRTQGPEFRRIVE